MPRRPDQVPEKFCKWCQKTLERQRYHGRLEDKGTFLKRKFCSISCGTFYQHSTAPPTEQASRKRAHKQMEGFCEICGNSSRIHVHHIDGNPMNNLTVNLQTLCANCHNFWHAVASRSGILNPGKMPQLFLLQKKE